MAFNGDEARPDVPETHNPNSYFEAFAEIAAALDALAKAVTPDDGDDGTPPDEGEKPCCNSYFASFRNIRDALLRVRAAMAERIDETKETVEFAGAFALAAPTAEGGVVQLKNLASNDVSLDGGSVAFAFPQRTPGSARSFALRLTMAASTEWSLPAGVSFESDDDGALGDVAVGETAVFMFTEMSDGLFLVSRKAASAVTKG